MNHSPPNTAARAGASTSRSMSRRWTAVHATRAGSATLRRFTSFRAQTRLQRANGGSTPSSELLDLQATAGNAAVSRLLRQPVGRALVQRSVSGISTLEQLKADREAWNTFLLLTDAEQQNFQRDAGDAAVNVSLVNHYMPLARASGGPVLQAWFAANIAAVAATAPDMMGVGLQDEADYGYGNLLRFRWFQVPGPVGPRGRGARIRIGTVGINLHRGPRYSGLGHAWFKFGEDLSFEFAPNLIPGNRAAIVQALELHAAGSPNNAVSFKANNANCR